MKREILKRALAGEKFVDLKIIDSHCHMGPWYNFYFPQAEIEEMIHDADIVGVDKLCIAPHASISCDYKEGNRQVLDAINKYPDRVMGLLVLNPNNPEGIDEEFDRYYSMKHFLGVKIHPALRKYDLNGRNYIKVFEKVKECGGYIISHTWEEESTCNMEKCMEVMKNYPGIPFVLGHSGGTRLGVEKSINLVNTYENAYMDTSGFEFTDTWIEDIAKKAEHTKIFFGSDMPFHDLRSGLSRILFADLDDEIKKNILGKNFENMILKYPKHIINAKEE